MTLSLELDRTSRVPIYQQVAGQIKELIGAGTACGRTLPTIRRLAERTGSNSPDRADAYAELQSGG